MNKNLSLPLVVKRHACRVCRSENCKAFVSFSDVPLTDDLIRPGDEGSEFLAPLSVFFCESCGTVQTLHDVDTANYYRGYRYTSSASEFVCRFMDALASASLEWIGDRAVPRVVEIGSGDGFQLSRFSRLGARVFGVEPSSVLAEESLRLGVPVVNGLFSEKTADALPPDMLPADVVLMTYTFDHLPDPLSALKTIRSLLHPQRGILVIEIHDLHQILQRFETCLFEHEHSIYLSIHSVEKLLSMAGFKLLTSNLVDRSLRRGNSLLFVAAPESSDYEKLVVEGGNEVASLNYWDTYRVFGEQCEQRLKHLRSFLQHKKSIGHRVAGYGAGGRGVMTLAQAGISPGELTYLCDQNAAFRGLMTPKTHIPVDGPDRLARDPVDDLVVFSYGYIDEIRRHVQSLVPGISIHPLLDLI